jgi:hypothetical protein
MANFGGTKRIGQEPESFASIPGTHSQHVEVHNIGAYTVWIGDDTLTKAPEGRSPQASDALLPPYPLRGRELMPGEYFHLVLNPNDELRACRIRDVIHAGAIDVDWRAEIEWYIVEDELRRR